MPDEQFAGVLTHLEAAFPTESIDRSNSKRSACGYFDETANRADAGGRPIWMLKPDDFIAAARHGLDHQAKAILILGPAADSLSSRDLRNLADLVLTAQIDLAAPQLFAAPARRVSSTPPFSIRLRAPSSRRASGSRCQSISRSRRAWPSSLRPRPSAIPQSTRTRRWCGR